MTNLKRSKLFTAAASAVLLGGTLSSSIAFAHPDDVRVTKDNVAGSYRYSGGDDPTYSDAVLDGCSTSHERQNEPAVEADPRNSNLLLASSNDYCAVPVNNTIWLGYYRSQNGGQSWMDSYVPGYPGDTSPASHRAQVDTTSAGDPVIAWDTKGNAYFGAEASGSETSFKKTNGDIWVARYQNPDGAAGAPANDASYFSYSRTIAKGSQAPNLLGKFNDKTAIEVDRTGGSCDGTVYFAYARFTAGKISAIWFTRSTASFVHYDAQDKTATGADARDCGDGALACQSGYTFFRQDSQVRSTADQSDPNNVVYVVYNATKPGTEVPTGTTYGTVVSGTGSQSGVYFTRIANGVGQGNGAIVDNESTGHQFFPDVTVGGPATARVIHLIWYDSREDSSYSPTLPNGDTATGTNSGLALNVFATKASEQGVDSGAPNFSQAGKVSELGTNGNWEQFSSRSIPFAGDYLWVTSFADGSAYVVWTSWRDTVAGTDSRASSNETSEPADENFDVLQCWTSSGDSCQTAGGKDQNIYGHAIP
ncbi:MAG: hypothetical protein E6I56_11090 [Chloroflexi bacterium]|nr:MAG: hypothetical protein E6I56_11090 [Chloroflexota bacterium]